MVGIAHATCSYKQANTHVSKLRSSNNQCFKGINQPVNDPPSKMKITWNLLLLFQANIYSTNCEQIFVFKNNLKVTVSDLSLFGCRSKQNLIKET